jgi:hypothetical protein
MLENLGPFLYNYRFVRKKLKELEVDSSNLIRNSLLLLGEDTLEDKKKASVLLRYS